MSTSVYGYVLIASFVCFLHVFISSSKFVSVMFVISVSCMVMVSFVGSIMLPIAGLCGGFSSFVSRFLYSGLIFRNPAFSLYWMRFCWVNVFAVSATCCVVWFSFSAISFMVCHVSSFNRSRKLSMVANDNAL